MKWSPGTVTKLAPFGAFIRLADGVEGLAHSSDLGNAALHMVNEGDIGQFRILSIDAQRRRIRLTPVEIYPPPDEDYIDEEMEGELAAVAESPDAEVAEDFDDVDADCRRGLPTTWMPKTLRTLKARTSLSPRNPTTRMQQSIRNPTTWMPQ